MIYATGDTHGDIRRFSSKVFFEQKELTKDDYVIILGDFGLVWDWRGESGEERNWLDWLEKKPFTTLFIDGNHENHDRLDALPVEVWNGGKIHRIRPSVIHLMRGQVYHIDRFSFFSFGGARSHDITDGILEPGDPRIKIWGRRNKLFRINKREWWNREMPSIQEMEEGRRNLLEHSWKVDYVLTHCAATDTAEQIAPDGGAADPLTDYLQEIKEHLKYNAWLFGHYHVNAEVNRNEICLFEQIVKICG